MFTETPEIVSRWREYFSELLYRPTTATEEALATLEQHPTREDNANPPTLEEMVAAIKTTKSGKTPGLDGLPAEIYKYGYSTPEILPHLFDSKRATTAVQRRFVNRKYTKRRVPVVTVGTTGAFHCSQLREKS